MYRRTQYPRSYDGGRVTKSITIAASCNQLLQDNEIENESAFISDLIHEALADKKYLLRRQMANIHNIVAEFNNLGGPKIEIRTSEER